MKKMLILLILLLCISTNVKASATEKEQVTLIKCMSASTAWVENNGKKQVIRLIAYDEKDTSLNETIKKYTCSELTKATKIEIAYDTESDKQDKYHRELVWVYVDDVLLQQKLIEQGYGEVNNAKKVYEHTDLLCDSEKKAIDNKSGIWASGEESEDYCKSGLIITTTKKVEKKVKVAKKKEESPFKLILICLVGIVILCITFGRGLKHEKK